MPAVNIRDERGQILILTAVMFVALVGMAGMALDIGFMYDKRNHLAAGADAAAQAAATEVHRGNAANMTTFAQHALVTLGIPVTDLVQLNRPPLSGPFAGNGAFVEAVVEENTATFFSRILGWTSLTPGARAVAGTASNPNCLITIHNVTIGNAAITETCADQIGGNLGGMHGRGSVSGTSVSVSGTYDGSGVVTPTPIVGAPPPSDPLAALADPPDPGGCTSVTNPVAPLSGGCYTDLTINTSATMNEGVYYFKGPLTLGNNATLTGSGVMLYFAGTASSTTTCTGSPGAGCINLSNSHPTVMLSAPTSGTYKGILMFQSRTNQITASFDGNNPDYNLSGAMYFLNAGVSFGNGLGFTNDCTLFVVQSLTIDNGNGSFSNTCAAYGGSPITTVKMAE